MPACSIDRVVKAQQAFVTGANFGIDLAFHAPMLRRPDVQC
jgi:hypothetical protein